MVKNLNAEKISERLGISRRMVLNWAKKYKWNCGKIRIKDFANQFSADLYSIGAKLLNKANDDLDNGRELNKHSINAIKEIVRIITKNEKKQFLNKNDFENIAPTQKCITPELIQQINRDILGWDETY